MLSSISFQNFRSHTKATFRVAPGITLIYGANTAGKTNILEGIMLLCVGKSFRAKRETEMLSWHKEVSIIQGIISDGTDTQTLEVRLTGGMVQGKPAQIKRYLVNGVARRQIDLVGNLRGVLFWPEDLELITDSPSIRRKYMDGVLTQIDREYRRNLASYERAIRQRNRLLDLINDRKATRSQLVFWNDLVIQTGTYITHARQQFLTSIHDFKIQGVSYRVEYDKSVISEARLEQYASEEVAARSTLVGPHRDDFVVYELRGKEEMDLSRYGSRGEQRLGVLWLKFAELSYIEKITGSRPILLLDDVFSELDPVHRAIVGELMTKQQTLITSADPETLTELKDVAHEIIRL
jgi:DNA replication and repair protein RecF